VTKSYTSQQRGRALALPQEALHLFRSYYSGDFSGRVRLLIERLEEREQLIERATGIELHGKRILDVGAGQRLAQMVYFSRHNDVVGIDLDVVVQGFDPAGYLRMLRTNGVKRTVKTLVRKTLLVDAKFRRELVRQLRLEHYPKLEVHLMDAENMSFPDASFDVVYSMSVFSHLKHPGRAMDEMARVLRPGGVAYNNFLLYTSRTGCMDLRLLGGRTAEIPLWAHLRPQHRDEVLESAYLNKIRLPEWRRLFDEHMPGSRIELGQFERELLAPAAEQLWAEGELRDFDMDELTTADVTAVWRKPSSI
jgi:SAM-dependent methyltransferase